MVDWNKCVVEIKDEKDIFIREGEREKYLKVKKKWKCNISIGYNNFLQFLELCMYKKNKKRKRNELKMFCSKCNVQYFKVDDTDFLLKEHIHMNYRLPANIFLCLRADHLLHNYWYYLTNSWPWVKKYVFY